MKLYRKSLAFVQNLYRVDAHYMGDKIELAEQAILKLEGKGW